VILVVGDDTVAEALEAAGADVRRLDAGALADPLSFIGAMRGVEKLFLAPARPSHEQNALAAAEQMGVYHVVKVGSDVGLQNTSLRWTVLMPEAGADPRGVTAFAARVLTEEGHENMTYVVTGREASP
jgi:hypothetical protein